MLGAGRVDLTIANNLNCDFEVLEKKWSCGVVQINGLSRFNQLPEPTIIAKVKDALSRLQGEICIMVDATGRSDLF